MSGLGLARPRRSTPPSWCRRSPPKMRPARAADGPRGHVRAPRGHIERTTTSATPSSSSVCSGPEHLARRRDDPVEHADVTALRVLGVDRDSEAASIPRYGGAQRDVMISERERRRPNGVVAAVRIERGENDAFAVRPCVHIVDSSVEDERCEPRSGRESHTSTRARRRSERERAPYARRDLTARRNSLPLAASNSGASRDTSDPGTGWRNRSSCRASP